MKNLYVAIIACFLSFKAIHAQHFVGDITLSGNTVIFSMKPQGGDISGSISILKFYLRWHKSAGNGLTFGSIINNTTNFPELDIVSANNDVPDPIYYNQSFSFIGLTPVKTYLEGVSYEVFRTTLGGVLPLSFDLVADNSVAYPYFFSVQGDDFSDYSTYVLTPFPDPTGSSGTFFYKTFYLEPLPITLKSFSGKAVDCNALLDWTTGSETNGQHFEIQHSSNGQHFSTVAIIPLPGNATGGHSYSKSLPLVSAINYYRLKLVSTDDKIRYSKVVMLKRHCNGSTPLTVAIIPNPVINHELRLQVSVAKEDDLRLTITDMAGKLVGHHNRNVFQGTTQIVIHLPQYIKGQYIVNIEGTRYGKTAQKMIVE